MSRVVCLRGIRIDDIGFRRTVELLVEWANDRSGGYVCTPNVDHIVRAQRDPSFRAAVSSARLRVPDGMGIVYGSRLAGYPIKETVTGRLLPEAVGRRLGTAAMALFGGVPGVAARAGDELRSRGVDVADAFGPSIGFEVDGWEDKSHVDRLRRSRAAIIFVGLGAPKQELWMYRHHAELPGKVLVGVGAALDVLAGRSPEAPRWMTRIGVEWAFRLAHEPRRLARRYLLDDPHFFWWIAGDRLSAMAARINEHLSGRTRD